MKKRICALLLLLFTAAVLSGCGGGEKAPARADLGAVYEKLLALPEMPEMLPISQKRMLNYYGVDPEACPQAYMANSADGLRVDELWLVEAKSEEDAKALLTRAEARISQLSGETENYRPEQYAVVKQARAVRVGSSVGLFISPQADKMEELFRAAFK